MGRTSGSSCKSPLTDIDGIAPAVGASRLSAQNTSPLVEQVRKNQHGSRSGDIYIIQDPYWFLFDKGPVKAIHGSPWRYDTYVPIVFAGAGLKAAKVHRAVTPYDIAATLATYLNMKPPSGTVGTPLLEVLQ